MKKIIGKIYIVIKDYFFIIITAVFVLFSIATIVEQKSVINSYKTHVAVLEKRLLDRENENKSITCAMEDLASNLDSLTVKVNSLCNKK